MSTNNINNNMNISIPGTIGGPVGIGGNSWTNASTATTMADKLDLKDTITKSINIKYQDIENLKSCLIKLEAMQFKEGDIATSKMYGNCLVCKVIMASLNDIFIGLSYPVLPNDAETGYMITAKEGSFCVPESDLIPYTFMSKELYGK
jgi:hypothetical protein